MFFGIFLFRKYKELVFFQVLFKSGFPWMVTSGFEISVNGLSDIIDGALKENKSITLAYPKWYEKEILELCEDHNIDKNKLDIITTNSVPAILRIRNFLNKLTKKKQKTNFEYKIKKIVFRIFIFWVSIVNPVNFFLFSSFLITIFLVTFPILLLFFLSYFFKKLLVSSIFELNLLYDYYLNYCCLVFYYQY